MKRIFFLLLFSAFVFVNTNAQFVFTFDDLMKLRRVGVPQVSPDGKMISFTIGDVNMPDKEP